MAWEERGHIIHEQQLTAYQQISCTNSATPNVSNAKTNAVINYVQEDKS